MVDMLCITKKIKSINIINYVYALLFLACFSFVMYKCQFGFGNIDESFYLTIPLRLCQGDGLLVDEFHLSQMSSVFIYPLMKIYLLIFNNTDGIILAFRYIYTVLHAVTSAFLYVKLRKISTSAMFVSLLYLIFTPFGIMALSYNSMGLAFLLIASTLIYTANNKPWTFYFAGLFLAGAVLCCPFLLLLYLYYFVLCVIKFFKSKNQKFFHSSPIKNFGFLTLGCLSLAVIFLTFVLSRASISEIINSIPLLFSDPEHPSRSIIKIINDYLMSFLAIYNNRYAAVILVIVNIFLLTSRFWIKSLKRMRIFLLVGITLSCLYVITIFVTGYYLNFLIFPFIIIGAFSFILFPKENIKEFLYFYLPGIIYGFCMSCSSNQGHYVISTASFISLVGSMIMFIRTAKTILENTTKVINITYKSYIAFFLIFCFLSTITVRYFSSFWDISEMWLMNEKINVGANKGIYTTQDRKDQYTSSYNEIEFVRNYAGDSVLYISENTWFYLEDKKKNASFSAWISGINEASSDRLVDYYKLDEKHLPDIIYCSIEDYNSEYDIFDYLKKNGYQSNKTDIGYIFIR